jgi:hypothetical protein
MSDEPPDDARIDRHDSRCAVPAATATLRKPTSHRFQHTVDERLVVEQLIDALERWLHQLAWVRCSKEDRVPERSLPVSASDHPDF